MRALSVILRRPKAERRPLFLTPHMLFLSAEDIKKDSRAQRVAHDMHLSFELGISLPEEFKYAVAFSENDSGNLFAVGALI